MTDGSDPLQEPASAPAGAATGRTDVVLAKGHLHPAVLLLRLLSAMRQAAFPLLLGVVVDRWFLVLAVVLFVAHLGYAVARYLTLEYTLTTDELRVREGLLERQERRIPLDRIQDLGFESTTLRLNGVVKNVTPVLQPGPPRYDVGVEFEDVDASAREFLERFVESRT